MSTLSGTKKASGVDTSQPLILTSPLNSTALGKGGLVVNGGGSFLKDVRIGGTLFADDILASNSIILKKGVVTPVDLGNAAANTFSTTGKISAQTINVENTTTTTTVSEIATMPLYSKGGVGIEKDLVVKGNILAPYSNILKKGNVAAPVDLGNAMADTFSTTGNITTTGDISTTGKISSAQNLQCPGIEDNTTEQEGFPLFQFLGKQNLSSGGQNTLFEFLTLRPNNVEGNTGGDIKCENIATSGEIIFSANGILMCNSMGIKLQDDSSFLNIIKRTDGSITGKVQCGDIVCNGNLKVTGKITDENSEGVEIKIAPGLELSPLGLGFATAATLTAGTLATTNLSVTGSQVKNRVFASPSTIDGPPTFRALTATDLPPFENISTISATGNISTAATLQCRGLEDNRTALEASPKFQMIGKQPLASGGGDVTFNFVTSRPNQTIKETFANIRCGYVNLQNLNFESTAHISSSATENIYLHLRNKTFCIVDDLNTGVTAKGRLECGNITCTGDINVSGNITAGTQAANQIYAGPSSGSTAAAPTFRSLVAADLPSFGTIVGTQTANQIYAGPSTGSTATAPTFRSLVTADLPSFGTIAGTQAANVIYAGPSTGSTLSEPTFRSLVAADLPSLSTLAGSQTQNQFFAAPSSVNGNPSFRPLVAADLPSLSTLAGSQTQNQFFATPSSMNGNPSFRPLVAADLPSFGELAGTQAPNQIYAGPSSGSTNATPTFRALQKSDLPSLSVQAGTQSESFVLVGPSLGSGTPTWRRLTVGDVFGRSVPQTINPLDPTTPTTQVLVNQDPEPTFRTLGAADLPSISTLAGSQSQCQVFAAPSSANGNPSFRQLTLQDIFYNTVFIPAPSSPLLGTQVLINDFNGTPTFREFSTSDLPRAIYGTQTPNQIYAGPSSGTTAAAPTFRSLTVTDLPSLGTIAGSQTQYQVFAAPNGGGIPVFRSLTPNDIPAPYTSSSFSDSDWTVDASWCAFFGYIPSVLTATTRTIYVSNMSSGRRVQIYCRNTHTAAKTINFQASSGGTGFASVNLSKGDAGGTSVSSVTLAPSSGTATITIFNAYTLICGEIS